MRSWEYFHNIELAKKLTLIAYIFITIPFVYSGIAQYQVGFFLYFVHAGVENQLNLEQQLAVMKNVGCKLFMESKLIYIANEKLKGQVKWPIVSDSEWIYFGAANEVKNDIVIKKINSHFSEQLLYVSWTRQDSFQTNKKEVLENIKHILGVQDFVIWNSSFSKAIEFNKIGVLRCGKVDTTNISTKRQILEKAINDYPKKNLSTSKELLFEIHKIIPFPITYPKLKEYSANLDLTKEAWVAESVESMLQFFGGQENEPLERIIDMLDKQ